MNSSEDGDQKKMNKAKSFFNTPIAKMRTEAAKRKSFDVNEAAKSLDLALVRLKKSKLVNGECVTSSSLPTSPTRGGFPEMFMDVSSNSTFCAGKDNASLMSINFSHYELARNLSNSLCNSDEGISSTARIDSPDTNIKNEHLERYFRSVEMWSQKYRDGAPSNLHLQTPK